MSLWVWGAPSCPYCGADLDWSTAYGASVAQGHRDRECESDDDDELDELLDGVTREEWVRRMAGTAEA